MTRFEQFLIDKGYIKFCLKQMNNGRLMYIEPERHALSTMTNLDHRYFHKDDPIIKKIRGGEYVGKDGITRSDRRGEIAFGLDEVGVPPTLIYPRPKMRVKRMLISGKLVEQSEYGLWNMEVALDRVPHEEIFEAMFDKSKIIEIDLT